MLIVALAFTVIFLFRDLQILAVPTRRILSVRFASYAILLLAGTAIFVTLTGERPAWTGGRIALGAIAVQVSQLMIILLLKSYSAGRYRWIGCILPAPAFLMSLYFLAFVIQNALLDVEPAVTIAIATAVWLVIIGGLAAVLCWLDKPRDDREFATDFAMMTTCTAAVFVPVLAL
jgi:hypothetical protein